MPVKPTLFIVTDIETTINKRMAFDIAWRIIDRKNRLYDSGSYIVPEAFQVDVPFYREKFGEYFDDIYHHRIHPASIIDVRAKYNAHIKKWRDQNHRLIGCAYNAQFDFSELPKTLRALTGDSRARWLDAPLDLLDIWDYWGESVPKDYVRVTSPSKSGKFLLTSAESAYQYEMRQPDFVEAHRAWHDCEIEAEILIKALKRKKKLPVKKSPLLFSGAVWHKINKRLGINGDKQLAVA